MQMFTYENSRKDTEENDRSSTAWSALKGSSQIKYKGPKMTREQYCLANNRFVMSPTMDQASESLYDPDVSLPWKDVENVISSESEMNCSICLGELNIPKVTMCGHIFCNICVLRYLFYNSEDSYIPPSQKCPLCNSHVSLKDLRPLAFCPFPLSPKGFRFRLMCMERGSMFAHMQPCKDSCERMKGKGRSKNVTSIPVQGTVDARFSRVVLGAEGSALRHIAEERGKPSRLPPGMHTCKQ